MSDPLSGIGNAQPGTHAAGRSPRGPDRGGGFREALKDAARSIEAGRHRLDAAIDSAGAGRVLSHEELLSLQAGVYRYTQELEIASKLVEKSTSAVRTTLQSQQ